MLKPKRKITRDQIKNDSFVETIFDIRSYVMDNSKLLSRIGGGFVVLLLLIVFLGQSSKNNKREAEFLLTQSNVYLDNGDLAAVSEAVFVQPKNYESLFENM